MSREPLSAITAYPGLCVDGPMDGQRYESHSKSVNVEMAPTRKLAPSSAVEPAEMSVTRVTYHWHEIQGVGLWLLEGETVQQAVEHMTRKIGVPAIVSRYEQVALREKDDAR